MEVTSKKEETGIAPHFVQPLKPLIVKQHEPAVLQCAVRGTPVPVVKWYRSGHEVQPDRRNELTFVPETGLATLTILEPTDEDQVVYSVKAVNTFGRAECRANLIVSEAVTVHKPLVLEAPRITEPLRAMIVPTGQEVSLEAAYAGVPEPDVRWYRNGKEIVPKAGGAEVTTREHRTTLRIPRAVKEDGGKYEIRAMNPAGEARSSGSVAVKVLEPEMAEVVPPRFVAPIRPQIVAEGEVVIMETWVESHPTCSFQWFQHSVPLKSSPELRVVTAENHSVLLVRDSVAEHAGVYTVRAENVAGSITCTATLGVVPEAEWEAAADMESPRFVERVAHRRVMDGERVEFSCQVTGKPIPKVSWFFKQEPVKEAKDVTFYQDTEGVCKLAISEVFPEDAGEYTCQAVNRVGEAVCAASLVVEAYEYVPDSEIASVTIGTSLVTGQSGSEEDLLAEKETLWEVTEEEAEMELNQAEFGNAPRFVTKLPIKLPARDGELTRLEVKVEGNPKPTVRWYKQGVEVVPTRDFQREDFEDGTSVLTILEVFPDDSGEVLCEAQNEYGLDQTVCELDVEGIVGTKEYRKPEWVTHMEELQEALRGNVSPSSLVPATPRSRMTHASDLSDDSLEARRPRQPPAAAESSEPSLASMSVGDDSVFVSNASSLCSVDVRSSVTSFHLSARSHVSTQLASLTGDLNADSRNVMQDYVDSHPVSISAVIDALEGNMQYSQSEEREFKSAVESRSIHLHERQVKAEEIVVLITEDSKHESPAHLPFYLLSPIRESSEHSTASSGCSRKSQKPESTLRLLSASCEALGTMDSSMASETKTKYQTFPRSKIPVLSPLRNNACYDVPEDPSMYPLEPRELDLENFQQLHNADSQEELQEFLLLESQCMTTDNRRGLAAAFHISADEDSDQ